MTMMGKVYPTVNQKVTLTIRETDTGGFQVNSAVQSILPGGRIGLLLPEELPPASIRPGTLATVEFNRREAVYRILTRVNGTTQDSARNREGHVRLLVLEPPETWSRIQRRDFFRLPISLPLRFRTVSLPPDFARDNTVKKQALAAWSEDRLFNVGRTKDLSGGGLLMITETPLSAGEEVFLELRMPQELLRLSGRVVRELAGNQDDGPGQVVGVEFVGIDEREQDQIIQFIFREERRRRHLGLA